MTNKALRSDSNDKKLQTKKFLRRKSPNLFGKSLAKRKEISELEQSHSK